VQRNQTKVLGAENLSTNNSRMGGRGTNAKRGLQIESDLREAIGYGERASQMNKVRLDSQVSLDEDPSN